MSPASDAPQADEVTTPTLQRWFPLWGGWYNTEACEASETEASEAAGAVLAGVGAAAAAAAAAVVGGCLLDWFVGWLGKLASKCSFAAAAAI